MLQNMSSKSKENFNSILSQIKEEEEKKLKKEKK